VIADAGFDKRGWDLADWQEEEVRDSDTVREVVEDGRANGGECWRKVRRGKSCWGWAGKANFVI
jgi:hypothetical protein